MTSRDISQRWLRVGQSFSPEVPPTSLEAQDLCLMSFKPQGLSGPGTSLHGDDCVPDLLCQWDCYVTVTEQQRKQIAVLKCPHDYTEGSHSLQCAVRLKTGHSYKYKSLTSHGHVS